jgi:hypothetical protein
MEVYAYVTDGIIELSDGIAKGSARVTTAWGDKYEKHNMGEYASTADNPVEAKFVYYHNLQVGSKFRLYVTVEDNAGNQVDTRDTIFYQIEVGSRPLEKEKTKDSIVDRSKSVPKQSDGFYYDSDAPKGAYRAGAYWYKSAYNGECGQVGIRRAATLRDEAQTRYLNTVVGTAESEAAWNEYWARVNGDYDYYTQDEVRKISYRLGTGPPPQGRDE